MSTKAMVGVLFVVTILASAAAFIYAAVDRNADVAMFTGIALMFIVPGLLAINSEIE